MSKRVAVITGGASGIGAACAERFANDGYTIAIVDQNIEQARGVAARFAHAAAFEADVSEADQLDSVGDDIIEKFGRVDCLVTSAGILQSIETVIDMDLNAHDRLWQVNYHGTVHACRTFGRYMKSQRSGSIITLGSINSFAALPLPAYCVAKTALVRLTEILAVELGAAGVRVNGVAPTYVITPAMQAKIDAGERDPQAIKDSGALQLLVKPHHIASAVAFLSSEQAAAITGVMLPVDAGWGAATTYRSFVGGIPDLT